MWSDFLVVFSAIIVGYLGANCISRFGTRISLIDEPNERSSHVIPTPRGGGIGIWVIFTVVGVFFTKLQVFTILAGLIGLIGLLEDRYSFPPKLRLLFQLIISILVVGLFSGRLPASGIEALFFLFWVLFITGTANFYNFMDGINGIAGLTGAVGFGLMAFFAISVTQDLDIALLSLVLSAGCLGFLPFNLHKAKVFMGDVGSILLGFVFACFVLRLSTNMNVFLCLIMFLSPFYADALVTLFYRWRRGENLMKAHRSHLYQYLTNELGLPHWKVSSIYAMIQAIFGLLAFLAYMSGLMWQILLLAIFGGMFIFTYRTLRGIKTGFATSREASI